MHYFPCAHWPRVQPVLCVCVFVFLCPRVRRLHAGGLPTLRPWLDAALEASRSMQHALQHAQSAIAARTAGSGTAAAAAASSTAGPVQAEPAELHKVGQPNGYLPSAPVLARSEFLEPVDVETLALYRRVLLGTSVAPGAVGTAVPGAGPPPALPASRA